MKYLFLILTSLISVSCATTSSEPVIEGSRKPSQATYRCIIKGGWCWAATYGAERCSCPTSDGWTEGVAENHQRTSEEPTKNDSSTSDEKRHLIYVTNDTGLKVNKTEEAQTLTKLKTTCSHIYGGQIDESSIWTGTKKTRSTTFAAGVCLVD